MALANRVRDQCLQDLSRVTEDPGELYWLQATLGEAALIRGELSDAIKWYTQAGRGLAEIWRSGLHPAQCQAPLHRDGPGP